MSDATAHQHSHIFLGEGHDRSERKTWAVIWLCGAMMIAEVVGGLLFGSIALVVDGGRCPAALPPACRNWPSAEGGRGCHRNCAS